MEGRYRMIQGSEEAVLWLQLSEPLTVGMFGDLRGEKRKRRVNTERRKRVMHQRLGLGPM